MRTDIRCAIGVCSCRIPFCQVLTLRFLSGFWEGEGIGRGFWRCSEPKLFMCCYRSTSTHAHPVCCPSAYQLTSRPWTADERGVVRDHLQRCGALVSVSPGGDVSHVCRRKRTGLYHHKGTLPKKAAWKGDRTRAERIYDGGGTQNTMVYFCAIDPFSSLCLWMTSSLIIVVKCIN